MAPDLRRLAKGQSSGKLRWSARKAGHLKIDRMKQTKQPKLKASFSQNFGTWPGSPGSRRLTIGFRVRGRVQSRQRGFRSGHKTAAIRDRSMVYEQQKRFAAGRPIQWQPVSTTALCRLNSTCCCEQVPGHSWIRRLLFRCLLLCDQSTSCHRSESSCSMSCFILRKWD